MYVWPSYSITFAETLRRRMEQRNIQIPKLTEAKLILLTQLGDSQE